jgi:ferritin-like metal-binding protein YciE
MEQAMGIQTLEDLFLDQLRDIYHAEKQLVKALPKLAKRSRSEELRAAFLEHLQQTEEHTRRIEQVFEQMGSHARARKCEAMVGLLEEARELTTARTRTGIRDAGLIGAAQKVEHYEIASYGTLITWAHQLGRHDCADILKQTLDEEKLADEKLSDLAESNINPEAASAGR